MTTLQDWRGNRPITDSLLKERAFAMLAESAQGGQWQLSPQDMLAQLHELDPYQLQDALAMYGWELLSGTDTTSERATAVKFSRNLFKRNPITQWAIWLYGSWGLGDGVTISVVSERAEAEIAEAGGGKLDVRDPDAVTQEFLTAERNKRLFGKAIINEQSDWLLQDGNSFWAFYSSQLLEGEATANELAVDEIAEIITHPENRAKPLFYKRVFTDADQKQQTWYYPDWEVFFSGELDRPYPGDKPDAAGNRLTLTQFVLPQGSFRADTQQTTDKVRRGRAEALGDGEGDEAVRTTVCVQHIAYNRKERNSLWGWPLCTVARPYTQAHKKFLESRATVAESVATYVRRVKADTGSLGIKGLKALRGTGLTSTSYTDTNPPAARGSEDIVNRAMEVQDLPLRTGASDAKTDNEMFSWWDLLGYGLFPTSAGLDTSRWATALEMDKAQGMLFTRYQTFLAETLRDTVQIVLRYREKFGNFSYGKYQVEVSIDSLSLADFKFVAAAIGSLVSQGIAPLVATGTVGAKPMRAVFAQLLRICLQALGIKSAADLTSDEAFGLEQAEPEAGGAEQPAPAAQIVAQPEKGQPQSAVERVFEMVEANAKIGAVDVQAVAEFAVAEMVGAR